MSFPFVKTNYEIKRVIGEGGTAKVYSAWDKWAKQNVAIKALFEKGQTDRIIREKFKQEANLYLYLEHENIANLTDFIIELDDNGNEKAYYIVMEYIDGYNLDEYIRRHRGYIAIENLVNIFMQILEALAYAHQQKVTHLDIKPSNIMLTKSMNVKILDFGISSSKDEKIENAQRQMGTPMFMSPEQVYMKNVGMQSDIYSLGVTLHYMVTGKLPYIGGGKIKELFHKIKHEKLPRLDDLIPHTNYNAKLQYIIDRATEKEMSERYITCEEFEEDLSNLFT